MQNITTKLPARLQTLLKQADEERAALLSVPADADAVYKTLIDSLAATLHNLPPAVEKSGG